MILGAHVTQAVAGGSFIAEIYFGNLQANSPEHITSLSCYLINYTQFTNSHGNNDPELQSTTTRRESGPRNLHVSEYWTLSQETSPKLLISDTQVAGLNKHVVIFEENLPTNWYPSYRGKLFSFKTKLTVHLICAAGKRLKTFSMNVKVQQSTLLNPDLKEKFSHMYFAGSEFEKEDPLKKMNPFNPISREKDKYLLLKTKYDDSTNTFKSASPNSLNARISDSNGEIAKLFMPKLFYQVGDLITGCVDLMTTAPPSTRSCVQFSVTLVAIESNSLSSESLEIPITCHAETCAGKDLFGFQIRPHEAVYPSFKIENYSLDWILKFEFVMACIDKQTDPEQETYWSAPQKLEVKTRKWQMPITLFNNNF